MVLNLYKEKGESRYIYNFKLKNYTFLLLRSKVPWKRYIVPDNVKTQNWGWGKLFCFYATERKSYAHKS